MRLNNKQLLRETETWPAKDRITRIQIQRSRKQKEWEIGVPSSRNFKCHAGNYILLFSVLPSTPFLMQDSSLPGILYIQWLLFISETLWAFGSKPEMFLDEIVIFFQYTPWELIHLEITPQCLLYNPAPCLTSALMRKETHLYTFTLFTEPLDRLPSQPFSFPSGTFFTEWISFRFVTVWVG